jgi:hypothetical protein
MERPTCETCPYFSWFSEDMREEVGECHRRAPTPLHDAPDLHEPLSWWPCVVANVHWCGEHPDFPAFLAATRPPASPAAPTPDPAPRTAE